MSDLLQFANREAFREWLKEHCLSKEGVWLLFGKTGGPETIKAKEALEEALCFGWIDGQMQSIDEKTYTRAYFDAKTDSGRKKRMAWMVDRLNKNLKPM